MKLGLALYRHQLDFDHYRFARQCGCTHLVLHLVDYFRSPGARVREGPPVGDDNGWGLAGDPEGIWTYEELARLTEEANAADLQVEAIENFDPAHWYDILLDGPRRARQLENLKTIIRNVGKAGIPVLSYHFSLAGVAGRVRGRFARGDAETVGMDGPDDRPIPRGTVWNMRYDPRALSGTLPRVTAAQLWGRMERFLETLLPVAEEAGVTLAAQPDDPPLPTLRGTPRLLYRPDLYQKLLDLNPSVRHAVEFCVGCVAQMAECDVYGALEAFCQERKVAYVRMRNVRGKAPYFRESFADDGDIDLLRVVRILRRSNYQGVIVADHAPLMSCDAPWHAGIAHTLGYLKAAMQACEAEG